MDERQDVQELSRDEVLELLAEEIPVTVDGWHKQ